MNHRISPNYLNDKLMDPSVDDYLDVYVDRVRGWILAPARRLLGNGQEPAAFALLCSYFESAAVYRAGTGTRRRSKANFMAGFRQVYTGAKAILEGEDRRAASSGLLDGLAEVLYVDGRCGAFHEGMFRDRIMLMQGGIDGAIYAITSEDSGEGAVEQVYIRVDLLASDIEKDLVRFETLVRDPASEEARACFLRVSKARHVARRLPVTAALERSLRLQP